MDFNKLKLFQIVAESGGVGNAAKIMHVTQPAVSQQIAILEDQLGFKLVWRAKGKLYLSPEAETLLSKLRYGFDVIENAVASLQSAKNSMKGTIKLGVLQDHSTQFSTASAIVKFNRMFPNITFDISFGTNADIEQNLRSGVIDLGLSIVYEEKSALHRVPLFKENHCFVGRSSLKKKSMEDVLQFEDLIDFTPDFLCIGPWIRKNKPSLHKMLRGKTPSVIVPNHQVAFDMVKHGYGCAVLPYYLCADQLEKSKIVKFPGKDLHVELDLAYLRSRSLRSFEKAFLDFLVALPKEERS